MERSDFLKSLASGAQNIQAALEPESRRWFVNLVILGFDSDPERKSPELDCERIYELMCYFFIVKAYCSSAPRWKVVKGNGSHGYRLPYAPGAKREFSFFRIEAGGAFYDICCGVELPVLNEPNEAPDVPLQKMGTWDSADREVGEVVGMWEAKYHEKTPKVTGKLTRSDFGQMLTRCDAMPLPAFANSDCLFCYGPEPFKVSGVVTNAPPTIFNRNQRLRHRFSIIFSFFGGSSWIVEPTRAEHEAYAAANAPPLASPVAAVV